ncbi:MAG: hypothetical protein HY509_04255 [Acidobacteria bacterium]|nr:hypothetical protein [Acidobacteriota bacterium]
MTRDPGAGPPEPDRCRFVTSYGGVIRCRESVYFHDFCQFHFEAYLRGELDERGHISEELSDQKRRREINYYGIDIPPDVPEEIYLDETHPGRRGKE